MKLRSRVGDDPFDGLTAEDIRRIRGGAAASVTPGLEGLARDLAESHSMTMEQASEAMRAARPATTPQRKKGRRS